MINRRANKPRYHWVRSGKSGPNNVWPGDCVYYVVRKGGFWVDWYRVDITPEGYWVSHV